MVAVGDLTPELRFPVALQCLGNGVQIDHNLHGVAGAFLAGLGVDDDAVIFAVGDDVGPAGQRCRFAAEFKPVLSLDIDVEAADFPVGSALVEQCGMGEQPLCLVEVGRLPGPVPVVGLEPDGPFAGVLTGEQARQPGGPDVGMFALSSRHIGSS